MAKLNSKRFKTVAKVVEPKTGLSLAFRDDRVVLRKVLDTWKVWGRLKEDRDPKEYAEMLVRERGWVHGCAPGYRTVERWVREGKAEATDGCIVEPDGVCSHGYPAWPRLYGFV